MSDGLAILRELSTGTGWYAPNGAYTHTRSSRTNTAQNMRHHLPRTEAERIMGSFSYGQTNKTSQQDEHNLCHPDVL